MTKNSENRNRVQPGVPSGGQFAAEQHGEPDGVTLTAQSPLDSLAVGVAGTLVRNRSNTEIGSWQRHMDKGINRDRPTPPMPEVLVELDRRAVTFETLQREEQETVLDQLDMQGVKHLLEPGQRLGNDKVRVADGVESQGANLGLALAAQKIVADADLPGNVTMISADENFTVFTVEASGVNHTLRVGPLSFNLATGTNTGDRYTDEWMRRATMSPGRNMVFQSQTSENIRRSFDTHRTEAALAAAAAASSFKQAGASLRALEPGVRTAVLRTDGEEFVVNVSGDRPTLETLDGEQLHPSMVDGFLNHMASQTGHRDGGTLTSELREVFRDAERRLIR